MPLRGNFITALFALLVPIVLLVIRSPGSNQSPSLEPQFLFGNWLYLAAPQLLVLAVAAIYVPSRRQFAVPALVASALLVAAFQAWVWFFVPPHEGGLAWVLYIPLWATLLAAVAGVAWLRRRGKSEL